MSAPRRRAGLARAVLVGNSFARSPAVANVSMDPRVSMRRSSAPGRLARGRHSVSYAGGES